MSTFAEDWAKEQGISIEQARKDIQAWLNYKSNKERWIEEQEEEDE